MRTAAQHLAELLGKSRLDLAKALVADRAPVSTETRSWLDGLRRFFAKAKPAAKAEAAPAPSAAAEAARDFHRGLRAALGQDGVPAASPGQEVRHRVVTFHTGDPDSPGHTLRMVPHPTKPGVWCVHQADLERGRALLFGRKRKGKRRSGATLALQGRA